MKEKKLRRKTINYDEFLNNFFLIRKKMSNFTSDRKEAFYLSIIDKLQATNAKNRDDVIKFLSKSSKFSVFVQILITKMMVCSDMSKKEALFFILMDSLLQKKPKIDCFDQDLIKKLIRTCVDYSNDNSDTVFLERMQGTIFLLLNSLQSDESCDIIKFVNEPQGLYSPFALAVYSTINSEKKNEIFQILLDTIKEQVKATFYASFSYFMEQNELEKLSEEAQNYYRNTFGGRQKLIDIIKPLLISEDPVKKLALKIIKSSLHFFTPDEGFAFFKELSQPIVSILHQSYDTIRAEVSHIFAALPQNCSNDLMSIDQQIRTYLPELAQHVASFENNPYMNDICAFVEKRKSVDAFSDIITNLVVNPKTARCGIFLTIHFEAYKAKDSLLTLAFPNEVSDIERCLASIEMIPVLAKSSKTNEEIFTQVSKSFFSILTNKALMMNERIRPSVFSSIRSFVSFYLKFSKFFVTVFLQSIVHIEDKDLLINIGSELNQLFQQKDKIQAIDTHDMVQQVDGEKYATYFLHLSQFFAYHKQDSLEDYSAYLRLVNPNLTKTPHNFCEMIDYFVPSQFIDKVKSKLIEKIQEIIQTKPKKPQYSYLIIASYFPSLTSTDIDAIVSLTSSIPKNAKDDDEVNRDIFLHVFKALSLRYMGVAFEQLYNLASEKQKSSFLFFGKKKKSFQISIKKAILVSIPVLLADNPTLSEQAQQLIYKTIICALPGASDMKDFAQDANKLIDVFPQLTQAEAPKELLDKVVSVPLFAQSLPYIITTQKNASKYIDSVIRSWVFHLEIFSISMTANKEISDLIFRISPTQQTLSMCLSSSIAKFNVTDPLPYVNFAYNCIESSSKKNIKLSLQELSIVLIEMAALCLSFNREIQSNAFHALMSLFDVHVAQQTPGAEHIDNDPLREVSMELSSDSKIQAGLNLFFRIFQAMPQEFAQILAEQIINTKKILLSLSNALILRSAYSVHGSFLLTSSKQIIQLLLQSAPQLNGRTRYQINTLFVDLSQKAMKDFLPVLLQSTNINYQRELIGKLLNSEQRRNAFFEQYNTLLASSPTPNMQLFQILPAVVYSENTPDIQPTPFGFLTSLIVIWLTTLYTNPKSLSRSEMKTAKEELYSCICYLFQRTNLCLNSKIEIHTSTFDLYAQTLCNIVNNMANLDIARISKICLVLGDLIKCQNDDLKIAAGIVFITLQSYLGTCTNIECVQLCNKLLESISVTFRSASIKGRRLLAHIFEQKLCEGHIFKMKQEHGNVLFSALVDSLVVDIPDYRKETLYIISLIILIIDKSFVKTIASPLLAALRKTAEDLPFSMEFLELLELYVTQKADFFDFAHNIKLNFIYLLELLNHDRQDVRNRVVAMISLLVKDLETKGQLSSLMQPSELVQFGTKIVDFIPSIQINDDILLLLKMLIQSLSLQDSNEADQFRQKVTYVAIDLSNGGPLSQKAGELLQMLLP